MTRSWGRCPAKSPPKPCARSYPAPKTLSRLTSAGTRRCRRTSGPDPMPSTLHIAKSALRGQSREDFEARKKAGQEESPPIPWPPSGPPFPLRSGTEYHCQFSSFASGSFVSFTTVSELSIHLLLNTVGCLKNKQSRAIDGEAKSKPDVIKLDLDLVSPGIDQNQSESLWKGN